MAGRAAPLARTWYPCAIVLSRRPKRAPRASTLEKPRERILLATALEMGRLANEALARTGLGEAVVVGEARRGAELVGEVSMIVRGPRDATALARALKGTRSCEQVEVTDPSTVRMRFEGGGPARLRIVPVAASSKSYSGEQEAPGTCGGSPRWPLRAAAWRQCAGDAAPRRRSTLRSASPSPRRRCAKARRDGCRSW